MVIEIIINKHLKVIDFHDCLHGVLHDRDMGTSMIEAKLIQQLAFLEQESLHDTFIDLNKCMM